MSYRPMLFAAWVLVLCSCGRSPDPGARAEPLAQRSGIADLAVSADPPASATVTPGVATRIVPDVEIANARAASSTGRHDHARFDRAGYLADPAAYLRQIAPERLYQVATPAADVPTLAPVGATAFSLRTGEEATLAARTEPGLPVTFVSSGLGEFPQSRMPAVTVAADAEGIARAVFRVTPGTVGTCQINAGSPVRAGTLQFLISIPEGPR